MIVVGPAQLKAIEEMIIGASWSAPSLRCREGWTRPFDGPLWLGYDARTAVTTVQDLLVDLSVRPGLQVRRALGLYEGMLKTVLALRGLKLQLLA